MHVQLAKVHDPGTVTDHRGVVAAVVPGDGRVQAHGDQADVSRHGAGPGGGREIVISFLCFTVGFHAGLNRGLDGAVADVGGVVRPHVGVVHAQAHRDRAYLRRCQAGLRRAVQVAHQVKRLGGHVAVVDHGFRVGVVKGQQHVAAQRHAARRHGEQHGLGQGLLYVVFDAYVLRLHRGDGEFLLIVGQAVLAVHDVMHGLADMGLNNRSHVGDGGVQAPGHSACADAQQVAVGGGIDVGGQVHVTGGSYAGPHVNGGFLLQAVEGQAYARVHAHGAAAHGHGQGIHVHLGLGRDIHVFAAFNFSATHQKGVHPAVGLGHGRAGADADCAAAQGPGARHDRAVVVLRGHADVARICYFAAQQSLGGVVCQRHGSAHGHAHRANAHGDAEHADAAVFNFLEQVILEGALVLRCIPVGHKVSHRIFAFLRVVVGLDFAADGGSVQGDIGVLDFAHAAGGYVAVQNGHRRADAHAHRAAAQRSAEEIDGDGLRGLYGHLLCVHHGLIRDAGDDKVSGIIIMISIGALGGLHVGGVAVIHTVLSGQAQVFAAPGVAVVVECFVVQVFAAVLGGGVEADVSVVLLAADLLGGFMVAVALHVRFQCFAVQDVAVVFAFHAVAFSSIHELGGVKAGLVSLVLILLASVAVHDHVGGVLAHGSASGQHHHRHARADDACPSHARAHVHHVALAVGFYVYVPGIHLGTYFRNGIAF